MSSSKRKGLTCYFHNTINIQDKEIQCHLNKLISLTNKPKKGKQSKHKGLPGVPLACGMCVFGGWGLWGLNLMSSHVPQCMKHMGMRKGWAELKALGGYSPGFGRLLFFVVVVVESRL